MATASWVAAQNAGAILTATYDTGTLNVTQITLDGTNARVPVTFSLLENGAPAVIAGQPAQATARPGRTQTLNVPAGLVVLQQVAGPGGTSLALPTGWQLNTTT